MTDPIPRLFVLRRDRDITGVSGPGDVADGVQWPDGSVVLRWRERPSTAVWDSLELMLSVHGHDGATRVVFHDEQDRARAAAGRAYQLADRWEAAHGSAMFLVRVAGAELRQVLDEPGGPCEQHPHAPVFDGLCGGCTQYPADMQPCTKHRGRAERQRYGCNGPDPAETEADR
ncbi:hypothetical protein [Streptomyces sp. JB150]|uniref:hypothetical protein n=1 Tax=Streptomyces sp. JB150 TaxID=2714844 RepID=UPI0019D03CB1|nr:hypothetical protein [Streptomyces sp. JB150]